MRRERKDVAPWRSMSNIKKLAMVMMACMGAVTVGSIVNVTRTVKGPPPELIEEPTRKTPVLTEPIIHPKPKTTPPDKIIKKQGDCTGANSCVSCLAAGCIWCANNASLTYKRATGFCLPEDKSSTCEDTETNSCPAILNTPLPTNMRVIHVGIQKGGPEALIQMHLALLFWGYRTTLDTRKNKQGGNIKSFFRTAYHSELEDAPPLRWFASYKEWLTTGKQEDVFIETETWPCEVGVRYWEGKGRQLQWHLTVWKKKPRDDCSIAAHTHYIAQAYMGISTRAVMYPYISPHIHEGASHAAKTEKTNLVLYDADAGITDSDLVKKPIDFKLAVAKGLEPKVLYSLYAKAKVCIDMKMPGAERFVYEAALYGCCIISDDEHNGGDERDLPIPERFRIKSGDVATLNARVQEILDDYDSIKEEFAPLREFVKSQRVTFLRQVRRYYSDNVHVVGFVKEGDSFGDVLLFLLAHVFSVPFATIEIVLPSSLRDYSNHDILKSLREATLLAAVKFTVRVSKGPYVLSFKGMQYVLAYNDIKYTPNAPDFVSVLSTQLAFAGAASIHLETDTASFSLTSCYPSCVSTSIRNATLFKEQKLPMVGSTPSTHFLCEHPTYASPTMQKILPARAKCT
eukprot:TRINITY_DN23074_c0_g1_i1.p1 TRINITY_DN23074_c0_g1~~TRINITY_DN23074_c0_g1_i1.p1  ORF type:complete len:628 (+),score=129.56 TRINITY_DN23074_c0_g1_i1:93-1976(+)